VNKRILLKRITGIVLIIAAVVFMFWLLLAPAHIHIATPLIVRIALAICAGAALSEGIDYLT
jgi:hypothetical protein